MNQKAILKNVETVKVEQEQTLRTILESRMKLLNMDIEDLEEVAKKTLFSVDGVMVMGIKILEKLETVVKSGQVVKLLPAKKAG